MTARPPAARRLSTAPLVLALAAYLPALATAPGAVAADTKQYLVLDPGRLLATAASLWDPGQFGGHVTHQQVGYLWPMGPWFWLGHALGLPAWVTQRVWLGTVFLAAGLGMRWLARHLGLAGPGAFVAALAYQLSPFVLSYANRTSGLLLPWAGLPALCACTVLAVRRGGWRWPAVAGLVAATVGGLNATALVLVAVGPALWLAAEARRAPRAVAAAAARLAACGAATAVWWAVPLALEARHGADVLAYSETIGAVATTASGPEVLRGLGYWLFYGGGVDGPWNTAAAPYLANPALQALGFALAAAGLLGLVVWRGPGRRWLAVQTFVGVAAGTLAFPPGAASPLGRAMLALGERSTAVLALRSSTRAAPLAVLGLAAGLGLLADRLVVTRSVRTRALLGVGAVAVLAANLPTAFSGGLVDADLRRPGTVPSAWREAAGALAAGDGAGRVLEVPGQEFAAYRWGTTTDPLLPGLVDRPLLTRDLLPLGSPEVMDLLWALDDRFQQGRAEPAALAPVARLLGARDVVGRLDAADERYRTPRPPDALAALEAASGLGATRTFGPERPASADPVRVDGRALLDPDGPSPAPAVVVRPVTDPVAATRTVPAAGVVVLAGSGDGVVDAAAAGLLDGTGGVRYAATLAPGEALPADVPLVLTDTNRRRARQWRGTQDTVGLTEPATPSPYERDEADARLPLFGPGDGDAATQTVADPRGGTVWASAYGEPNAYRPEDRAALAADGDPTTAWRVADRGDPTGERWRLDLTAARPVPTVRLVQPPRPANRWLTEVVVRTEHRTVRVALDDASRSPAGQVVPLGEDATAWLEVELTATSTGVTPSMFGLDAVGFAEIDAGVRVDEVLRLPAPPAAAGATDRPVAVVLTRDRVDPAERWRADPEAALARSFVLPAAQEAPSLTVEARVHQRADDAVLRALLDPAGPVVRTSSRLVGSAASAGGAALDGDPSTAWTGAVDDVDGAWWEVALAPGTPVGRVTVRPRSGPLRSTVTTVAVSVDGAPPRAAAVGPDGTATVDLGATTGAVLRVTVTGVDVRTSVDRRFGEAVALPVALAEVEVDGLPPRAAPSTVDTGCRDDLLTLDGHPVAVRLRADARALRSGAAVALEPCGALGPLAAGAHELRAAPGARTGIDLDRVVLRHRWPSTPAPTAGPVTVRDRSRWSARLAVPASTVDRWVVWGEGRNDGWRATVGGVDLGPPRALVGGGNAWLLPAGAAAEVRVEFTPQRWVWAGFAVSGAAALACLALAAVPRRRAVAPAPTGAPRPAWPAGAPGPAAAVAVAAAVALAVHPLYGAGVLAAWWCWRRSAAAGRGVGLLGPALALTVGGYVVARQVVSRPVAGFGWPLAFDAAHRPALAALAVVVLVALDRRGPEAAAPGSPHERRDEEVGGGQRQQRDEGQVEPGVAEEGPHGHEQAGGRAQHGAASGPR